MTNKKILITIKLGNNRRTLAFQNFFISNFFLYFNEVKKPEEKAKMNRATVDGIQTTGIVSEK